MTQIALPNSTFYKLTYDSTYGLINKITYPNGGYVSYVWGLNSLSANIWFPDLNGNMDGCEAEYSTPAVMHRYVSFDGSHTALEQDFSYQTTWTSPNSWTKTTTVATTDFVGGESYTTVYTYSSYEENLQPNVYTNFGGLVPTEHTIQYKDSSGNILRTETKAWQDPYELLSQWPDPSFPHRTEYDFRIQEGAERCRGASTRKRR